MRRYLRQMVIRSLARITLVVFFSGLFLSPARANLGDTIEQAVKRYGKPTGYSEANAKTPFGSLLFRASGLELIVFILNNREVGARVAKMDKSGFSDQELQAIIDADVGGSAWITAPSSDPTCLQWIRSDKATALYDREKHMLIITSTEMTQAVHTGSMLSKSTNAP